MQVFCPFCEEKGFESEKYLSLNELRKHFYDFHNYSRKDKFNGLVCRFCKDEKRRNFDGKKIVKPILPFNFIYHIQKTGHFQIRNDDITSNHEENMDVQIDNVNVNVDESDVEDNNIENSGDEEVDIENSDIDTFNIQNVSDPIDKAVLLIIKTLYKNCTITEELYNSIIRMNIEVSSTILNTDLAQRIFRYEIDSIPRRAKDYIEFVSPFDMNERIFDESIINNAGDESLSLQDVKSFACACIKLEFLIYSLLKQNNINYEDIPDGVLELTLYADEISMSALNANTPLTEFLHMVLRPYNIPQLRDSGKLSSMFTWCIVPVYQLKIQYREEKYKNLFQNLLKRFDEQKIILYQNRKVELRIVQILGDHSFLDEIFNINKANGGQGSTPSCRICNIPPNMYEKYLIPSVLNMPQHLRKNSEKGALFGFEYQFITDPFHDIAEGVCPQSIYLILQKLCSPESCNIPVQKLNACLTDVHRLRTNKIQNISNLLRNGILIKKLDYKKHTFRKIINFGGMGNVELMFCLIECVKKYLTMPEFESKRNIFYDVLQFLTIMEKLFNIAFAKDDLSNVKISELEDICRLFVRNFLLLGEGNIGFSKKLHYLLHYPFLKTRWNHLSRMCCQRFESMHVIVKRYYKASMNHRCASYTILKKLIIHSMLRDKFQVIANTII